ncbi:MAG: Peptide/nickel transport system permease protein [Devosia sp.]|nr:Peptide/nickel transport system permease protein [Devosia sp.]
MTTVSISSEPGEVRQPGAFMLMLRYLRRNKGLAFGIAILIGLTLFTVIGLLVINPKHAYPLSAGLKLPPSLKYPFGTDFFGRNLLAAMVVGMWQTAFIGLLAGGIGTFVGVVLGFTSAYFGGWVDTVVRTVCQILTPIPVLLIQVVVAGSLDKRDVTIFTMAIIVAVLAWMGPTLVIRAQVLTMKERQFVSVAKLSGVSDMGIIFKEILPNLLPFIGAAFVGQVFAAVFASFYLAVLGLGPLREPLLGNIIWAAQGQGAFFNGWWWWPIEPSVAMILILGSLALINMGLDELANPRVRRTE